MVQLTAAERRELRARAHHLNPVVMVGEAGLTPAVLHEVDIALRSHELIKIRAAPLDREARVVALAAICERTGAQPVQHIGKMLVVYRPRPPGEASTPAPPARRARTSGWDERRQARAAKPVHRRRSASPLRPPRRGPRA